MTARARRLEVSLLVPEPGHITVFRKGCHKPQGTGCPRKKTLPSKTVAQGLRWGAFCLLESSSKKRLWMSSFGASKLGACHWQLDACTHIQLLMQGSMLTSSAASVVVQASVAGIASGYSPCLADTGQITIADQIDSSH